MMLAAAVSNLHIFQERESEKVYIKTDTMLTIDRPEGEREREKSESNLKFMAVLREDETALFYADISPLRLLSTGNWMSRWCKLNQ